MFQNFKVMTYFNKDEKMADVVLSKHFLIFVLERFNIPLGVQEKTIEEICKENDISLNLFLGIANLHINPNIAPEITLDEHAIYTIIDYLKNSHAYYTNEAIPSIAQQIKEISNTRKDTTYTLIERFFNDYKEDVSTHLLYEESIVYPYVTSLLNLKDGKKEYTINNYKNNHEDIESKLDDLKNLLIKHLPDQKDQEIRRKLLFKLFRFEKDLIIHTIIEEQILIPHIEAIENLLTR